MRWALLVVIGVIFLVDAAWLGVPRYCYKVGSVLEMGAVPWLWTYSLDNYSVSDFMNNLVGKEWGNF